MFSIPQDSFEVRQTKKKGRGVFATKEIKKGTIIGNYLGKLIRYEEIDPKDYPFLMYFNDEKGIVADKEKTGVHLLNHSCEPNCTFGFARRRLAQLTQIVTIKGIKPGEELTISYNFPPLETCTNCTHQCFCGSKNCLKTMHTPKRI